MALIENVVPVRRVGRRRGRLLLVAILAGAGVLVVAARDWGPWNQPRGRLVGVWGQRGLMPGRFVKPRAIAIDREDRLFLVDMRAVIQMFDREGNCLANWSTPTHEFGRPSGLAIDREGNLVVADSHYHRLLFYDPSGRLLRTWGGDEGEGLLAGEFGYIGDVAVDSQGHFYVAESQQNERITKLSPQGRILHRWGGRGAAPGRFQRIRALDIDAHDLLYVADACNHRIQIFDGQGRLLRIVGEPGSGLGQLRYPYDVALARDGSFYVCEYGNHRIQRFAADGTPLAAWGRPGRGAGELYNPWAVGVDSQGQVYVVDSNNHRVQRVVF